MVATANFRYDYGFLVVGRDLAGTAIEDVVGSLLIAFNQPRVQSYRVFGYPNAPDPPCDGEKLWACDTAWASDAASDTYPGRLRLEVDCDFGAGASGGPWLSGQGAVASVSSSSPVGFPNISGALTSTAMRRHCSRPPGTSRPRRRSRKRSAKRASA